MYNIRYTYIKCSELYTVFFKKKLLRIFKDYKSEVPPVSITVNRFMKILKIF